MARVAMILLAGSVCGCALPPRGVGPGAGDPAAGATPHASLDTLLAGILRATGSPAVAAAVVRGGSVIAAGAVGVRRLGSPDSVRITDRFFLGSVAKPMTATLMAVLVERGTLSWSSTPSEVFPELSGAMDPSFRGVTLRQLLTHTAGLANFNPGRPEWEALPRLDGSPMEQRRAFTAWVLARPPSIPPGSGFLYSNAGAPIAAAMAERVTGRAWEDLMQDYVFGPLSIETAGFGWPAAADLNQPWGHWAEGDGLEPHDPRGEYRLPAWMASAGDIHMAVLDLARFAAAHLGGLRGAPGLVRPEMYTQLHTPVVARTDRIHHGIGWHVWAPDTGPRAGNSFHGGGGGTFVALVEIASASDLALVVMTNDGREPSRTVSATLEALVEVYTSAGSGRSSNR